jgi:2,3-bisphosphoglycerate-dependent phosphoglycerate mutase
MSKLVLLRHGFSAWNLENRFTGWADVDLSERGVAEAHHAGELIRNSGIRFHMAFSASLKRAIRTTWIVLEESDQMWVPEIKTWHLNERHYGALQGLNKSETAAQYGEEQVHIWRRSFSIAPPAMDPNDPRAPRFQEPYLDLDPSSLPLGESLEMTMGRVVPYWQETIYPLLKAGKTILVTGCGNSLRALIKHIDGISDEEITGLNIPTGQPLVYEFDGEMKPTQHYYLAPQEEIDAAIHEIKNQGKAATESTPSQG